jgi:hypothetical protein
LGLAVGCRFLSKHALLIQSTKVVRERVTLIIEPSSESGLAHALNEVGAAKFIPPNHNCVLIMYDIKQAGESMSRPQYRMPPFRKAHVRKLIGAVMQVRGKKQKIMENNVFVLMDAYRHGNEPDLLSSFLNSDGKLMAKEC